MGLNERIKNSLFQGACHKNEIFVFSFFKSTPAMSSLGALSSGEGHKRTEKIMENLTRREKKHTHVYRHTQTLINVHLENWRLLRIDYLIGLTDSVSVQIGKFHRRMEIG